MTVTETASRRNGVDVATLFATLDAVRAQPEIARFQFRSAHRWVSGTHNRGTINGFYGAGQENLHETRDRDRCGPPGRPRRLRPRARPRRSCSSTRWVPA